MAESSLPWTGTTPGDAGPYSASQWQGLWQYGSGIYDANNGPLIGSGVAPDKGLFTQQQSPLAAGITLTIGSANVQGLYYRNSTNLNLAITPNASGNARIDTLVLRKDTNAQTVRAVVLVGTPAASPVPLALTQTALIYEIPLADIAVANGFATITNSNITVRRHYQNAADGIYLWGIKNNTAGDLVTGDIVIWDGTGAVFTTAVELADARVAGVWVGRTASGGYGRLLVKGTGYVRVTGSTTRAGSLGCNIITTATAKVGKASTSPQRPEAFAVALEAVAFGAGTGLCLCYVDCMANTLGYEPTQYLGSNEWAGGFPVDVGANQTVAVNAFTSLAAIGQLGIYSNHGFMFGFTVTVTHSVGATGINFDVDINGTKFGGVAGLTDGLLILRPPVAGATGATTGTYIGICDKTSSAFSPGAVHSLTLFWKTGAATATLLAGAGAAGSDVGPTFWVKNL